MNIFNYLKIIILAPFIFLSANFGSAFVFTDETPKDTINSELFQNKQPLKSIQVIVGDTLQGRQTAKYQTPLPGEYQIEFTPEQDSAYKEAMKLRIPPQTRISEVLRLTETNWVLKTRIRSGEPWQIAVKNVQSIPPSLFLPNEMEIVHHQINILNSQYVPHLNTMPMGGVKIPLSVIGALLGLTEDVSPTIKYKLEYISNVEIVIYSVQAVVVATIFRGTQPGGSYSITWTLLDDNGKKMPPGDYIAEVRIGNDRYIRKRIVIY